MMAGSEPSTTDRPAPALVAAARLKGDRSQQVFDVLLRTLAQPGTVHRLPELPADVPAPAWLALALADVDVAVAVDGPGAAVTSQLIAQATDAPIVEVDRAAIVVALGPPDGVTVAVVSQVAIGTALAPEDGARLALPVAGLNGHAETDADTETVVVALEGPGVDGRADLAVAGLDRAVIEQLGNVAGRFPVGFDTWLFGPDGAVAAIPRSTVLTVDPTRETDDRPETEH